MNSTVNIKGILFDKDGTLLDFNASWLKPYLQVADLIADFVGDSGMSKKLMRDGGYLAESQSWVSDSLLASGSNQQIYDFWSQSIGHPIEGELLQQIKQIFSRAGSSYVAAIPDLKNYLIELKNRDIKIGLATMDDNANAEQMIEKLQLQELFDFVCGADSGYGVKPEPGMINAFCDQCMLPKEQIIMVGDSPKDINMGKNAGVGLTLGVLTGAHNRHELEKIADQVFDDISGILTVL